MAEISIAQIKAAFVLSGEVFDGKIAHEVAVKKLNAETGLNSSSARDFIAQYRRMLRGEVFKRSMSVKALDHFLTSILYTRGREAADRALSATWQHINYYESLDGVHLYKLRSVASAFQALLSSKQDLPKRNMYEAGKVYDRRRDIHDVYGGQAQSGIVTPREHPYIFLFTSDSGEQYGYKDDWTDDGVYLYTGEGQAGDMQFVRGNKAIRDHAANGKSLLLFKALGKSKGNRFIGEFTCSSWETRKGQDRDGSLRDVIVFHLVPLDEADEQEEVELPATNLDELRKRAYQAASPAAHSLIRTARQTSYERSRDVKAYVLARAEGICESCGKAAPFTRRDGSPYLEPHHTKRVSDGGPDDPRHVGAICPNCHREIHHGQNGIAKNSALEKYLLDLEGKHALN